MKKSKAIILIIFLLLVLLILFKNSNFFHKEELSLNQIKEQLVNTQKIYICDYSESITKPCHGKSLIRIEDDKQIIKEVVEISINLEEFHGSISKMKDNHTLYFVDENNAVIVSADFGYNFIFKTSNKEYLLDPYSNEKLRKLLNFYF